MGNLVDLFLCDVGVAVAYGSFDSALVPSEAFEGFFCSIPGSGNSGRSGSPRFGDEAVCQLSSDRMEVSGVVSRYRRRISRCKQMIEKQYARIP
jgi:hypothetical protein